jgi:hypothetical protein
VPKQQVFWRISNQRQFGRENNICAQRSSLTSSGGNALTIPGKITHGTVDLRDSDVN